MIPVTISILIGGMNFLLGFWAGLSTLDTRQFRRSLLLNERKRAVLWVIAVVDHELDLRLSDQKRRDLQMKVLRMADKADERNHQRWDGGEPSGDAA